MDAYAMSASPNHEARTLDHENVTPRIGAGGGLSFVTTALRVAFVVVLVCVAFFVGGFLRFATTVSHISPSDDINADAIVVLTGGADRIEGALDLLANGHAKRLLISGVHPKTTRPGAPWPSSRRPRPICSPAASISTRRPRTPSAMPSRPAPGCTNTAFGR